MVLHNRVAVKPLSLIHLNISHMDIAMRSCTKYGWGCDIVVIIQIAQLIKIMAVEVSIFVRSGARILWRFMIGLWQTIIMRICQ